VPKRTAKIAGGFELNKPLGIVAEPRSIIIECDNSDKGMVGGNAANRKSKRGTRAKGHWYRGVRGKETGEGRERESLERGKSACPSKQVELPVRGAL